MIFYLPLKHFQQKNYQNILFVLFRGGRGEEKDENEKYPPKFPRAFINLHIQYTSIVG